MKSRILDRSHKDTWCDLRLRSFTADFENKTLLGLFKCFRDSSPDGRMRANGIQLVCVILLYQEDCKVGLSSPVYIDSNGLVLRFV